MELVFTYKEPTSRWAVWAAVAWSLLALSILKFGDRVSASLAALKDDATPIGALGFTAVIFAPAVLMLASAWIEDVDQQRAFWVGLASAFIWVAYLWVLYFAVTRGQWLRPAVWFLVGRVIWGAINRADFDETGIPAVLSLWIALSFGAALVLLFARETPICWDGSGWTSSTSAPAAVCKRDIVDTSEGALALGAVALGLLVTVAIVRLPQREELFPAEL